MYRGLLLSSVITMEHMFLDLPYLEVRAFPFTAKVFQKEFALGGVRKFLFATMKILF